MVGVFKEGQIEGFLGEYWVLGRLCSWCEFFEGFLSLSQVSGLVDLGGSGDTTCQSGCLAWFPAWARLSAGCSLQHPTGTGANLADSPTVTGTLTASTTTSASCTPDTRGRYGYLPSRIVKTAHLAWEHVKHSIMQAKVSRYLLKVLRIYSRLPVRDLRPICRECFVDTTKRCLNSSAYKLGRKLRTCMQYGVFDKSLTNESKQTPCLPL